MGQLQTFHKKKKGIDANAECVNKDVKNSLNIKFDPKPKPKDNTVEPSPFILQKEGELNLSSTESLETKDTSNRTSRDIKPSSCNSKFLNSANTIGAPRPKGKKSQFSSIIKKLLKDEDFSLDCAVDDPRRTYHVDKSFSILSILEQYSIRKTQCS